MRRLVLVLLTLGITHAATAQPVPPVADPKATAPAEGGVVHIGLDGRKGKPVDKQQGVTSTVVPQETTAAQAPAAPKEAKPLRSDKTLNSDVAIARKKQEEAEKARAAEAAKAAAAQAAAKATPTTSTAPATTATAVPATSSAVPPTGMLPPTGTTTAH